MLIGDTNDGNLNLKVTDNEIIADLSRDLALVYKLLLKSGKLLPLDYLFGILLEEKLIKNSSPSTKSRYWTIFTEHRETFTTTYFLDKPAIGLRKWVPWIKKPKRKLSRNILHNITNITVKQNNKKFAEILKYQHKLSNEEVNNSFLLLAQDLLSYFKNSGTGFPITIYCYGDYSFNAWINTEFSTLHAPELKKFFYDNQLNAGDIIYTEKRMDDPTGIHLYTVWQISENKQLNGEKKSDNVKPNINEHIKADTTSNSKNNDYDPIYLLSLIQNEDLVYKFVKVNGPSTVLDIIDAISKELAVKKENIVKLSLIDFSDARIVRLSDGKIALKEYLQTDTTPQPINTRPINDSVVYIIIAIIMILIFIALAL